MCIYQLVAFFFPSSCRDRSASLSMRRVPVPGGAEGQYQDDWIEFYHLPETEKEFPLRNQQVST